MYPSPYREQFPKRAIFPVIHTHDHAQVLANLAVAEAASVDGVFLIQHGATPTDSLESILQRLRQDGWFERIWIGANFLAALNHRAFALAHQLGLRGIWTDNAHALTTQAKHDEEMRQIHNKARIDRKERPALNFGGVAFKYQHQHGDGTEEAHEATQFTDVVTTSGPETGVAAELEKLQLLREAVGDHPLAVASGVTAANVTEQLGYVDAVLVATSINNDFHHLDPTKLAELVDIVHTYQPPN